MSHLKERTETNCLNCNAEVYGKFCHVCGQENIQAKESVFHLVNHFFQDITHFDGKFFSSVKLLLLRPGFLSMEYIRGRRMNYLNPIRMYIFTSALFFLLFFTFITPKAEGGKKEQDANTVPGYTALLQKKIADGTQVLKLASTNVETRREIENDIAKWNQQIAALKMDSTILKTYLKESDSSGVFINLSSRKYTSQREYDSVQQTLPASNQDNFFARKLQKKIIELNKKSDGDKRSLKGKLLDSFFHKFPQVLFLSLPFFALLLKLVYLRRKEFYYVNHLIFTIHLYVFTFTCMLLSLLLSQGHEYTQWEILDLLSGLLFLYIFFYQYKAMRFFYQQSAFKTFAKLIVVNILSLLVLVLLFAIFFFLSLFQL